MEKYLFTDGTNVIREVQSKEELHSLIQSSADPLKIRIWIFNTSEWISLAEFNKRSSRLYSPVKKETPVPELQERQAPLKKPVLPAFLKKTAIGLVVIAGIFLIYNFTKVSWSKADPLDITAVRPANTPLVNADSLIETIESLRGQKLDKVTRTNLRIRNTWPELLQLKLTGDRDISREGSRFYNVELMLDNSTGYRIDNAVVKLSVWNNDEISSSSSLQFTAVDYTAPVNRKIEGIFKGDSISVSFSSIRSKAFNFCYSADKESNYGNYNDRWFCK